MILVPHESADPTTERGAPAATPPAQDATGIRTPRTVPRPPGRSLGRGLALIGMGLALLAAAPHAAATIQEESCISPDIEYPVPCED